ncbi:MAG: malate/lactate/ureidoglycolate dehydrogenase [Casimicrobiaceae bacterium]
MRADDEGAALPQVRIAADDLRSAVAAMFGAAGCSGAEATVIASGLVQANLFGHDSHGVVMTRVYLDNIVKGLAVPGRTLAVVTDAGALVGADGQRGFGQSIGVAAMELAIGRARQTGSCILGLSNTHHLGRIGGFAEQCADAGFASVHFVNVLSTPLVAPWGGADARLATNPFCVGVPHAPHPIVLDYATSIVAMGKARVAVDAGRRLPPGHLLDANGQPTDDPAVMFAEPFGALLPFAQHKGYALAVMCELLGGALSGGRVQDHHPRPSPMINNMLSIVFAPDRLCTREAFAGHVARLTAWLRASPPARPGAQILLPGEPERATARERSAAGVPLPAPTRAALAACARRLGLPADVVAVFR